MEELHKYVLKKNITEVSIQKERMKGGKDRERKERMCRQPEVKQSPTTIQVDGGGDGVTLKRRRAATRQ